MTKNLRHLAKFTRQATLSGSGFAEKINLADWAATHRHKKGGLYRVLRHGMMETDKSSVVVCDDADGQI